MAKYSNLGDVAKASLKYSLPVWLGLQSFITIVGIVNQKELTIPQFRSSQKVKLESLNSNTSKEVEDFTGFTGMSFKAPLFNSNINKDPLIAILFPFAVITQDQKYTREAILNLVSFGFNSPFPKNSQADIGSLKVLSNGLQNITSPFGNSILKKVAFEQVDSNPLGLTENNVYNILFRAERSPEFGQFGPSSLRKIETENIKLCQQSLENVKALVSKNAQEKNSKTVFTESCSEREFSVEEYEILQSIAPTHNITGLDNEEIVFNLVMAVNQGRIKDEKVQEILDKHRIVNSTIKLDPASGKKYFAVSQYSVNPILSPLTVYLIVFAILMLRHSYIFSQTNRPKYSYYQLAYDLNFGDLNSTLGDNSSQTQESLKLLIKEMINDTLDDTDVDNILKEILRVDQRIKFAKDTLIDPDKSWNIKYYFGLWQACWKWILFDKTAIIYAQILEYEVMSVKNQEQTSTLTIDQKVNQVVTNINNHSVEQLQSLSI